MIKPDTVTPKESEKFTVHHATQYKALSDDMRYYADQRFKVLTAYLIASGFFINAIKDLWNPVICVLGATLSYLCFAWDLRTTRWWATLITQCQALETLALSEGKMIEGYLRYVKQIPAVGMQSYPHPKPTQVILSIYVISLFVWLATAVWHFLRLIRWPWWG